MSKFSIDFETFSEVDIRKTGAWIYSMSPSTEVICMAYAQGDEAPKLWLPHEPLPDFVSYIQRQPELHAWNSFFEWCIWTNVLNWPAVPIQKWYDTAA